MIDVPETPRLPERAGRRDSVAIPSTCTTHKDGIGWTTLMVSKRDGGIKLDPHMAGLCVITLDEDGARALFELLGKWFG